MPDISANSQIVSFVAIVLLIAWSACSYFQVAQMKKKLKVFFQGSKASDLEGVLSREIQELKKTEKDIKDIFKSLRTLNKISEQSIQKVGLVRFNPFKEIGGDQSFAIALLDYKNSGVVISSLYSREGSRIYSKPVKQGRSEYPLSKEEEKALKQAGVK